MQLKTLQNVPNSEPLTYLRVAAISSKTALCFLYIGNDNKSIQFLMENCKSGFTMDDFESAKKLLKTENNESIDVIIIDLPYNEKELKAFYFFLRNKELSKIPLIYNEHFLINSVIVRPSEIIDDVIDLSNWQFDFYTKVNFLKNYKQHRNSDSQNITKVEPAYSLIKRVIDIILASFFIILLLPVYIIIAIVIKLDSRGPIFYNASRAGKGFKIFKFYKFRTMEINADKKIEALAHLNQYNNNQHEVVRFFKISNDPRITKVGRFLRNTSLDELPQLFNVVKGDMSLVGNRPLPLYEAATLTTNECVERFMAPAGITGLWQIKKRGKAEISIEERIELDISYARKANVLYDLWIMARTPAALFQKTDV